VCVNVGDGSFTAGGFSVRVEGKGKFPDPGFRWDSQRLPTPSRLCAAVIYEQVEWRRRRRRRVVSCSVVKMLTAAAAAAGRTHAAALTD